MLKINYQVVAQAQGKNQQKAPFKALGSNLSLLTAYSSEVLST